MIDNTTGRTWGNAPAGVRDARILAWIVLVIIMLALIGTFAIPDMRAQVGMPLVVTWCVYLVIHLWLPGAFKSGVKAAYYVQIVVALIGLLGFPIGTIIYLFILFKWFRPETRAWFGV